MRSSPASFLAIALAACGGSVAPADSAVDAANDTRVEERPTADAPSHDAQRDDVPADVAAPDVADVLVDAGSDASADAATPAVLDVTGERICGVSIVDNHGSSEFALVYGYQSGRTNEARLVRLTPSGEVIMSATIAAGGTEPICVSRESLQIVSGLSRDPSLSKVYVVALQRQNTARQIEMMVLDERGTHLSLGARDETVTAAPITASNLVLRANSTEVTATFEARAETNVVLRTLAWSVPAIVRGMVTTSRIAAAQTHTIGPAGPDVHLAISASAGGGGSVAWTEYPAGPPSSRLLGRGFSASGWVGAVVELARGENVWPVSATLFHEGVRSVSLRMVQWLPWVSTPPAPPVTVAQDTAWHQLDAVADRNGLDVRTWVSHGSSGYNSAVLQAPRGEASPERCVLFRAADERSTFVQVAQARFASRNQLVAAIERAGVGASQRLRLRALADGETVCPR